MRGHTTKGPAIARAGTAWGSAALDVQPKTRTRGIWSDTAYRARLLLRSRGMPVSRWLDDQAGRRRGDAVESGIRRFTDELATSGVPLPDIIAAMTTAAAKMVETQYNSRPAA